MVREGIAEKTRIDGTAPAAVIKYSLSLMGESTGPLLKDIEHWGGQHKNKLVISPNYKYQTEKV